MIAHVAEAGEQRGRVVLQLGCTAPSRIVLEAAIRIAQAFQSEIESLFIEAPQIYDVACFPHVREISLCGRARRDLSPEIVARQMRQMAHDTGRRVTELARLAEVPTHMTIVRDEPLHAMAKACRDCGPWNVIVLGDQLMPTCGTALRQLFEGVADTTGIVVVGPHARTTQGPILAAIEDIGHLEPMLRAARRLLPPDSEQRPILVLIGDDADALEALEGQVRLVLGADESVGIVKAEAAHGAPAGPADTLRRFNGGFVIGQLGSRLIPADGDLRHLAAALACPLFVVR